MCLTNCLCLTPNGLFEGNNLVIAFMKFLLGKLWRLAYVCALAFCPATHSRHCRACPCIVAARRVGKMRTRWPRHRRFHRVASLSAGRVGEAPHPDQAYTKHLRCPHYPTWLSLPCLRFLFLTLFSFLVACFAAELLGSMGRTKDRASQMSWGLSNNALLEVTVQLRQQNQVLLNRLASQQSVNRSVMGQARHTPATISIASMVHPAADSAWKTKKTKSGPARDTSAKVIIQDGWSVPVVHSFEEFRLADTSICLATRSEAEEAMRQLRSGSGLAVLTTKQFEAGSEEIKFEVKTSQGLSTMWKRYLVPLGDVPVTYKCSAPRGGAVEADTSLVVIGVHKKYCHPDAWKTATSPLAGITCSTRCCPASQE